MQLIAHRGFAAEHPENTLAAFRAASRTADAVEFDVRRCGSGDLVGDAQDAGLDVNAWTVRDRVTAAALRRAGVDGLIADHSDVAGG